MKEFSELKGHLDPGALPSHSGLSRMRRTRDFLVELLKIVVISLAIIIPIRQFLIQPFYVKGASMEPNFYDHEYLIIDEITYRFRQPSRGEIVVFRAPGERKQFFIKRIIGLPNEKIEIKQGKVFIGSEVLDETAYLPRETQTSGELSLTLEGDHLFVLGDNRNSSFDSRSIGPITKDQIVGRALLRGWPPSRIKLFEVPEYE